MALGLERTSARTPAVPVATTTPEMSALPFRPNNSMNADLVPLPSSLVTTLRLFCCLPQEVTTNAVKTVKIAKISAVICFL